MEFHLVYVMVFCAAIFGVGNTDTSCKKLGGKCVDWRYNICTNGVRRNLCRGDSNRRCCFRCASTPCVIRENRWKASDGPCTNREGKCQQNSNFCRVSYHSGLCGGPTTRQCCVETSTPSGASDSQCTVRGGQCQLDSNHCPGSYHSGLCGGPSARRCCIASSTPSSASDSQCTVRGGKCQLDSIYCPGSYLSGLCGGPSSRRCCIASSTPSGGGQCISCTLGDIADLNPTGASQRTARQDRLNYAGVRASEKLANTDLMRMKQYKNLIAKVAKDLNFDGAIIAAIISRESRAGAALDSKGYGDHGNGYGLMQVDKRHHHRLKGGPYSEEHIRHGTEILISFIRKVQARFPSWTRARQLQGGVAAYNFGLDNVRTWTRLDIGTTGNDYSSDVIARAKYFRTQGY
ncbi:unnamed protein product [Clavelina lepadiformis]|uniref:Lysozyme g n=1 Tax=Clavelina lepadiformis TaxID=159417 RepID=A0ABP0FKN0_CLALP